jgi:hypothetical protein
LVKISAMSTFGVKATWRLHYKMSAYDPPILSRWLLTSGSKVRVPVRPTTNYLKIKGNCTSADLSMIIMARDGYVPNRLGRAAICKV